MNLSKKELTLLLAVLIDEKYRLEKASKKKDISDIYYYDLRQNLATLQGIHLKTYRALLENEKEEEARK
jgi:hypothetical protein